MLYIFTANKAQNLLHFDLKKKQLFCKLTSSNKLTQDYPLYVDLINPHKIKGFSNHDGLVHVQSAHLGHIDPPPFFLGLSMFSSIHMVGRFLVFIDYTCELERIYSQEYLHQSIHRSYNEVMRGCTIFFHTF